MEKNGQRPKQQDQVIVIYVAVDMTIKRNATNQINIKKMIKRKNLMMKSGEIKLMSWIRS